MFVLIVFTTDVGLVLGSILFQHYPTLTQIRLIVTTVLAVWVITYLLVEYLTDRNE